MVEMRIECMLKLIEGKLINIQYRLVLIYYEKLMNKILIKELDKKLRNREYQRKWRKNNKEYHREYMREFRKKQRMEKLEEQRLNPKEPMLVKKSFKFLQEIS